jgi:hypothetical protein
MPADPVSGGCGCALLLAVCAVYFAGLSAWVFLKETGLLYPCAAALLIWVVVSIAQSLRRRNDDDE